MESTQSQGCWFKSFILNFWDILGYGCYFMYPFKKIKCPTDHTIEGKTVLITGATQGIGRSTAFELGKRGAKLILACRNVEQANQLARELESMYKTQVLTVHLDLTSLQSVRQCAATVLQSVDRLDILINNAGMAGNPKRKVTVDGYEQLMQVNHFGPWLFTRLLLPLVKSSSPGRIIFTASSAHRFLYSMELQNLNSEKNYSHRTAYSKSKLANILTTSYLSSMLKDSGVTVNSFCPGPVATSLADDLTGSKMSILIRPIKSLIMRTPDQGAQTMIYLATDKSLDSVTGKHFMDCAPMKTSRLADDFDFATKLWEITEKTLSNHVTTKTKIIGK